MENLELRCQEVRSILTRVPQGIVNWGIGSITAIWILLLIGSYLFRYPETISAEAVISTENPPAWLCAKVDGSIQELLIKHLQRVENGQILAVLENPANFNDVSFVKELLSDSLFSNPDSSMRYPSRMEKQLTMGELQTAWSQVLRAYSDYYSFLRIDSYSGKISALKEEIVANMESKRTLMRQEVNQNKACALVQYQLKREKELYRKGIIAQDEYQKAQEVHLNSKQLLEEIRYKINSCQMEQIRIKQDLQNTEIEHVKAIKELQQQYILSIQELSSAIQIWELKYVLISPTEGFVSFTENRNLNDQISIGDRVFAIISGKPGSLIGHLKFSSSGSGKVQKGQIVQIRIDGYPYLEFGTIQGTIQSTSLLSDKEHLYTAEVFFPKKLVSTYKKQIEFRGELTGTAEIRTQDMRLIERIFSPIKHLLSSMNR